MSVPSDRSVYWSEVLAKQKVSGQSAVVWCRNVGISYNSFAGWRTRLNREAKESGGWVSVKDVLPAAKPLTLRIGAVEVDLSSGFDPHLLWEVVAALSPKC
jgi:hypothetical protein